MMAAFISPWEDASTRLAVTLCQQACAEAGRVRAGSQTAASESMPMARLHDLVGVTELCFSKNRMN